MHSYPAAALILKNFRVQLALLITVPVLGFAIPEMSLFKDLRHSGHAEVEIYTIDGGTGKFIDKSPPTIGEAQYDDYTIMIVTPSGRKIGTHYGGPHWESTDGSKIAGTVKERANAPQADAIPWLLLITKSVGSQGSFDKITSIQRVNAVGGVEPKTGCSQSIVGTTARIPYTADYYFLTKK